MVRAAHQAPGTAWAAATLRAGWGARGASRVGGSRCEHPGVFASESVSQPWLLVMPGETEPWFQFCGYSVMAGAEQ